MEILPCKRSAIASSRLIDDILVEILIRLPESKTLIRFKLVCKHWNFIISSHYFFRRCIAHQRPKANSFSLLYQLHIGPYSARVFPEPILSTASGNTLLNLDFIPKIAAVSPSSKDLLFEGSTKPLSIKASFNDLLLLTCLNDTVFYVVNPQTRHWISLPPPPPPSTPLPRRRKMVSYYSKYGLLCNYSDPVVKYKVIRIPHIVSVTGSGGEFSVEIFCSESKQWSVYIVDWYHSRLNHCLCRTPIVSNNGMFHWVNGVSLVSLNPFDLVLIGDRLRPNRMIELPRSPLIVEYSPIKGNSYLIGFGVTCGYFRLLTMANTIDSSLCVWQLDEEASGNPWRIEIKVPSNSPVMISLMPIHHTFLGFHPYQKDVIFLGKKLILQINLRTHCSEYLNEDSVHLNSPDERICFGLFPRGMPPPLLHQWLPTKLTS